MLPSNKKQINAFCNCAFLPALGLLWVFIKRTSGEYGEYKTCFIIDNIAISEQIVLASHCSVTWMVNKTDKIYRHLITFMPYTFSGRQGHMKKK
jgi:hypothetical protein